MRSININLIWRKQMAKKKSRKKWIILAVVAVIVILAVFGFIRLRNNIDELAKTTYVINEVGRGDIEVEVKGAGAVEPLYDDTVYASFTGTVSQVLAENGDVVKADDIIAVFDSDAMDEQKQAIEDQIEQIDTAISTMRRTTGSDAIYSPVEGVVKIIYAQEGDNVDVVMDRYGALSVICPDKLMQTKLPVDIASSYAAMPGETVTVSIGDISTDGTIYSVVDGMITVQFEDDDFMVGDSAVVTSESGIMLGTGSVEIANPVYITAHGGVIEDIREPVGDKVRVRTKLFTLDGEILSADLYSQIQQRKDLEQDLADIETDIESLTVYAGTDGVVSNLALNKEQIVQPGTPLFTVQSNGAIKLDVDIDEIDIVNIELGQEATVEFDALPEKTYTAHVIKINPVGVSVNNVTNFTITLQIEPASEIMLGMSADVKIVSQSAMDVLVIPIEAIQVIEGEKYVVFEEDIDEELNYTVATHKIETGITDGVMIEVTSGLSEGDRVAVPQARELTAQELQQRMFSRSGSEE